jgi:glycosyltransferase involved in cell wall biosynthesis
VRTIVKIGIVTISFNQSQFIEEAIKSVISTTDHQNLRYVIVDAGSTDGSRDVINRFTRDVNDTIFEADDGPADGLNKGFKICDDCDIFGYLNSDDRFAPGALDWVRSYFIANTDIDVVVGGITIMYGSSKEMLRPRISDTFSLSRYAIGACNVFQQGTFFRRRIFEAAGGFNVCNRTCWDGELVVDMALAGGRFHKTRRLLGAFRIHSQSITGSRRLASAYEADRKRIAEKIYGAGIKPVPTAAVKLVKIGHKLSAFRHMEHIWARCARTEIE